MAWSERRDNSRGTTWRVLWRQDGERKQVTFATEREADEFRDAVTRAHNRWPRGWIIGKGWADEQAVESDAPTFRDFAERTIPARARADDRTRADYLRMLACHVYPVIGHKPIDTITRFDVHDVAKTMRAAGRSSKTIANVHAVTSSVFDDALQKEDPPLIRRNPARGELPKSDEAQDEIAYLSRGEFRMIRANIPDQDDRDLATLLAGTGLRWSEATALQVQALDLLNRKTLSVRRAWKRRGGLFVIGTPKSKKSRRTISLSPVLVEMLARHVAGKAPTDLVFTTKRGHAIRHSNWYSRVWQPAVLRARQCDYHARETPDRPCDCPGVLTKQPTIHTLRHSHVSWLIDDKITLLAVQERVGHDSIDTTIRVYGHLAPGHVDELNTAVDRALVDDEPSPAAPDAVPGAHTPPGIDARPR